MMYQEFLNLSGANEKECNIFAYYEIIEPAYMNNDLLFPTKDEVAEHWRRFGLLGFSKVALDSLTSAVKEIQHVCKRTGQPRDGMANFTNFIGRAIGNN